jgi:t-SNARE complex subunit (syntaxin)
MLNRLGELNAINPPPSTNSNLKTPLLDKNETRPEADPVRRDPEIAAALQPYEPIKVDMETIRFNTDAIQRLNDRESKATDAERRGIMTELDGIMTHTTNTAKGIKKALSEVKMQNQEYEKKNPGSAKNRIRSGFFETHTRRFKQDMNEYNQVSFEFKQSLQTRTRRQLKILDSDSKLSDEAIDKIVEEGQAQQVIQKLSGGEGVQDVVRDIEMRHEEILRLEKQVLEVYELFKDLSLLVETQQESLDIIEKRVGSAKDHVTEAAGELEIAEEYQRKSRKKTCCLIVILLAVLVAILAPTLYATLGTSA